MWHDPAHEPVYSEYLELDVSTVVPSLAGPKRPQDRVLLSEAKASFEEALGSYTHEPAAVVETTIDGSPVEIGHGIVAHRRDHVLHQHVEPLRDDGRRAAGQEGGRARPVAQAVGQDDPRPGLEGGHRLLREGRPDPVPRQARLQRRRLRLHGLHRQLRPADPAGQRRGQRRRPGRRVRAQRQPQLRGPDQPRREDELPRVAAAGGRLRPRRDDGHRPRDGAARLRRGRQRRVPRRHLADHGGDPVRHRLVGERGDVPVAQCATSSRATSAGSP